MGDGLWEAWHGGLPASGDALAEAADPRRVRSSLARLARMAAVMSSLKAPSAPIAGPSIKAAASSLKGHVAARAKREKQPGNDMMWTERRRLRRAGGRWRERRS
jgi:hypothetical protein